MIGCVSLIVCSLVAYWKRQCSNLRTRFYRWRMTVHYETQKWLQFDILFECLNITACRSVLKVENGHNIFIIFIKNEFFLLAIIYILREISSRSGSRKYFNVIIACHFEEGNCYVRIVLWSFALILTSEPCKCLQTLLCYYY